MAAKKREAVQQVTETYVVGRRAKWINTINGRHIYVTDDGWFATLKDATGDPAVDAEDKWFMRASLRSLIRDMNVKQPSVKAMLVPTQLDSVYSSDYDCSVTEVVATDNRTYRDTSGRKFSMSYHEAMVVYDERVRAKIIKLLNKQLAVREKMQNELESLFKSCTLVTSESIRYLAVQASIIEDK